MKIYFMSNLKVFNKLLIVCIYFFTYQYNFGLYHFQMFDKQPHDKNEFYGKGEKVGIWKHQLL